MRPWLRGNALNIVLYFCLGFRYLGTPGITFNLPVIAGLIVGFDIGVSNIYCHLAVYSLYENIKENSQNGHVTNEPAARISIPTNTQNEKTNIEMV